jgi:hypothetical protein
VNATESSNEGPDHVHAAGLVVDRMSVEEVIRDCGIYFTEIYDALSEEEKVRTWKDVGTYVLAVIAGVGEIRACEEATAVQAVPPILPHQLVLLRSYEFNDLLLEQKERYISSRGPLKFDLLQNEHRDLLRAYRTDEVLRETLLRHDEDVSFEEGWKAMQGRLPLLQEFCGGLATVFPGTATVESDFSVIHSEKSCQRKALTDMSLEGIMHCKQLRRLDVIRASLENQ